MAKLFLLRHLKSQWNLENRFTGWVDVPVSKEGSEQAKETAGKLAGNDFDAVYTSSLIRNQQTVIKIFKNIGEKYPIFKHLGGKMEKWSSFEGGGNYILVYVSDELNERYYGKLQGLNKDETAKKYGEAQAHLWRRSYDVAPPGGESLKDTYKRAIPFYKKYIEKNLESGKNILIVSSGNALRAIVKYIENIPDEKIIDFELPFGALVKYDFDNGEYTRVA